MSPYVKERRHLQLLKRKTYAKVGKNPLGARVGLLLRVTRYVAGAVLSSQVLTLFF